MNSFSQPIPENPRVCHECHTANPLENERCLACGIILWMDPTRWAEDSSFATEYRNQWFKEQEEDQFINACKSLIPLAGVAYGFSAMLGTTKAVRRTVALGKTDIGYRFSVIRRLAFIGFFLNVAGINFLLIGAIQFFSL